MGLYKFFLSLLFFPRRGWLFSSSARIRVAGWTVPCVCFLVIAAKPSFTSLQLYSRTAWPLFVPWGEEGGRVVVRVVVVEMVMGLKLEMVHNAGRSDAVGGIVYSH